VTSWKAVAFVGVICALAASTAWTQEAPGCVDGQSLDDAWWTGPMLAPSAGTLPRGHILIEPYLFDVARLGHFDRNGSRQDIAHVHGFGSLTYMLYGVTDHMTVGLVPTAFYAVATGVNSSGPGLGDLAVLGQYRFTQFQPCGRMPTLSVNVQETLPTGRYDRLGARPNDGFGSGTYTTTLSAYAQTYFWMPNGRILRMRLNASQGLSSGTEVAGASVYGTGAGFLGRAEPGNSFVLDASWEYSATRAVVAAFEAVYRRDGSTRVFGSDIGDPGMIPVRAGSTVSHTLALAPALEFSWRNNIGVLIGVRVIAAGRNTPFTITPAIAINYVH